MSEEPRTYSCSSPPCILRWWWRCSCHAWPLCWSILHVWWHHPLASVSPFAPSLLIFYSLLIFFFSFTVSHMIKIVWYFSFLCLAYLTNKNPLGSFILWQIVWSWKNIYAHACLCMHKQTYQYKHTRVTGCMHTVVRWSVCPLMGHSGCFQILASVSNECWTKECRHLYGRDLISPGFVAEDGLPGLLACLLISLGISRCFLLGLLFFTALPGLFL